MKITVIISALLIVQVSASFFDVFQGAVKSVQSSFGKLFSDVVTDVKDTVDCTILAVEHVLSLSQEATARYYEKCGRAPNGTVTEKPNSPVVEISIGNNEEYLKKEIPEEVDARINATLTKFLKAYNPHDKLENVEKDLTKETERLAKVSELVKQELDKLSNEIHFDLNNLERKDSKLSIDSILEQLKLLEAIEKRVRDTPQGKEIHRLIDDVLHKLNTIEAEESSENAKVEGILKDLENNSNSSYIDLRQQIKTLENEEAGHLVLIKLKLAEHEKSPEHLAFLQNATYPNIKNNSTAEKEQKDKLNNVSPISTVIATNRTTTSTMFPENVTLRSVKNAAMPDTSKSAISFENTTQKLTMSVTNESSTTTSPRTKQTPLSTSKAASTKQTVAMATESLSTKQSPTLSTQSRGTKKTTASTTQSPSINQTPASTIRTKKTTMSTTQSGSTKKTRTSTTQPPSTKKASSAPTTQSLATKQTPATTTQSPSTKKAPASTTQSFSAKQTPASITQSPSTKKAPASTTQSFSTKQTSASTTQSPSTKKAPASTTQSFSTKQTPASTTQSPSTKKALGSITQSPSTKLTSASTTQSPSTKKAVASTTQSPSTKKALAATTLQTSTNKAPASTTSTKHMPSLTTKRANTKQTTATTQSISTKQKPPSTTKVPRTKQKYSSKTEPVSSKTMAASTTKSLSTKQMPVSTSASPRTKQTTSGPLITKQTPVSTTVFYNTKDTSLSTTEYPVNDVTSSSVTEPTNIGPSLLELKELPGTDDTPLPAQSTNIEQSFVSATESSSTDEILSPALKSANIEGSLPSTTESATIELVNQHSITNSVQINDDSDPPVSTTTSSYANEDEHVVTTETPTNIDSSIITTISTTLLTTEPHTTHKRHLKRFKTTTPRVTIKTTTEDEDASTVPSNIVSKVSEQSRETRAHVGDDDNDEKASIPVNKAVAARDEMNAKDENEDVITSSKIIKSAHSSSIEHTPKLDDFLKFVDHVVISSTSSTTEATTEAVPEPPTTIPLYPYTEPLPYIRNKKPALPTTTGLFSPIDMSPPLKPLDSFSRLTSQEFFPPSRLMPSPLDFQPKSLAFQTLSNINSPSDFFNRPSMNINDQPLAFTTPKSLDFDTVAQDSKRIEDKYNRAVKEARQLIAESRRAHLIMDKFFNKKIGKSVFGFPKSLNFG